MQPRSDRRQRCLNFQLEVWPHTQILTSADCMQNVIHYFDIPRRHTELVLRAKSLVMVDESEPASDGLDATEWDRLDEVAASGSHWDWLSPSQFARSTTLLADFGREIALSRSQDPLNGLFQLNEQIHNAFEYNPFSTVVDSPIDIALQQRRGVCQDFTHVMIALLRQQGIPTRYISGYLVQDEENAEEFNAGASHAWVEAYLPSLGWVGLDPTNNTRENERHIRIAVGRDYADVPPTRGIYRGDVKSELSVGVHISQAEDEAIPTDLLDNSHWTPREQAGFDAATTTVEGPGELSEDLLSLPPQQQQQ